MDVVLSTSVRPFLQAFALACSNASTDIIVFVTPTGQQFIFVRSARKTLDAYCMVDLSSDNRALDDLETLSPISMLDL